MTNFELYIIIAALVMPIVALFLVHKKSTDKEEKPKKEEVKINYEKPVEEKPIKSKPEKKKTVFEEVKYSPDEFKGYLEKKHEIVSKPQQKTVEDDTSVSLDEFMSRRRVIHREDKNDESLEDLSPELKVMLLAGVLNKKYFD